MWANCAIFPSTGRYWFDTSSGGAGQFRLTRSACSGGVLLAGEAAGFQDALWGFGIRYALLSGCLAARSLLSGPASGCSGWLGRNGARCSRTPIGPTPGMVAIR